MILSDPDGRNPGDGGFGQLVNTSIRIAQSTGAIHRDRVNGLPTGKRQPRVAIDGF